jgi:hypothetical protein
VGFGFLQRGWRVAERRHPAGRERIGSPTLQTLQDPVLLCLWTVRAVLHVPEHSISLRRSKSAQSSAANSFSFRRKLFSCEAVASASQAQMGGRPNRKQLL